jgi:iron-sulfur cluster insertion protein
MSQVTSQESVSDFPPPIMDSDIQITPVAQTKLVELFADAEEGLTAIRVFVSGGGCGGMSYGMTFSEDRTEYDHVMEREGFNLYVDAVAMNFLRGVEIDFVERPTGASFVFNNVFAATGGSGTCGACGAAGGGCG